MASVEYLYHNRDCPTNLLDCLNRLVPLVGTPSEQTPNGSKQHRNGKSDSPTLARWSGVSHLKKVLVLDGRLGAVYGMAFMSHDSPPAAGMYDSLT